MYYKTVVWFQFISTRGDSSMYTASDAICYVSL
jgi:hypothetical protein